MNRFDLWHNSQDQGTLISHKNNLQLLTVYLFALKQNKYTIYDIRHSCDDNDFLISGYYFYS